MDGAEHVTSLDVDPAAVENAHENMKRNHVENDRVDVRVGRIDDCAEGAEFGSDCRQYPKPNIAANLSFNPRSFIRWSPRHILWNFGP